MVAERVVVDLQQSRSHALVAAGHPEGRLDVEPLEGTLEGREIDSFRRKGREGRTGGGVGFRSRGALRVRLEAQVLRP